MGTAPLQTLKQTNGANFKIHTFVNTTIAKQISQNH